MSFETKKITFPATTGVQTNSVEQDFRQGSMLNNQGQYAAAVEPLRRAFEASRAPAAANNLAIALIHSGQALAARILLEQVLEEHAQYTLGWLTYGAALKTLGQHKKARQSFAQALAIDPGFVAARQNLAATLHSLGNYAEAVAEYETVLKQLPDELSARIGLCRALQSLNRHPEVIEKIAHRFGGDAAAPELNEVLALSYERTGDYEKALVAADTCRTAGIDNPGLNMIRANCLSELGEYDDSLTALAAALEDVGEDTKLLSVIASFMESMKMFREASEIYETILQIDSMDGSASSRLHDLSMHGQAKARLFDLRLSLCDWEGYEALCGDIVETVKADIANDLRLSIDVFNLQALPLDYAFVANAARHHAAAIAREMRAVAPAFQPAAPEGGDGRTRIGYLLPYTWIHSLPLVLQEIVRLHDRQRFEIIGYCTRPCNGDDFSRAYRATFDRFVDVPGYAPAEAARMIHDDRLDLLVDVAGLTGMNCMDVLSFRPAPIQAHFLGYSITTGADYVDYLITDRTYIPPELRQHNAEQLVYLPDTFMATVRQDESVAAVTRAEFGLPADATVFANFNHPCKFEPVIFGAWMDILKAAPGSMLWFGSWMDEVADNLRREAEARGVSGDRLIFSEIVDRDVHLARLALADLALDNLYHGGGITTVDALWAGLPVLSIAGEMPGARLGATLLNAANMPELIVPDLDTYVRTAIDLAGDPERIQALKSKLVSQRDTCPLFDTERYCRNLENAFRAMCDNLAAGNPPAPIDLTIMTEFQEKLTMRAHG